MENIVLQRRVIHSTFIYLIMNGAAGKQFPALQMADTIVEVEMFFIQSRCIIFTRSIPSMLLDKQISR